jgi:glycosyltransferase involved in cell wall biosynthesis
VSEPLEPLVSVVIPTIDRPGLLPRAVDSALAQTLRAIEVIVVVDGPDGATRDVLARRTDERLRVEHLTEHRGIGAARNAGVRSTRGAWVAFLDDDDEWSPGKLEAQLRVAEASPHAHPIVTCRVAVGGSTWPRRLPDPAEPLSEYLFSRRTPFWGEALIQTSTILCDRALARSVPFDERLPKHEDLDWLLRASRVPGAVLAFVPSPDALATWYADDDRPRASTAPDWRRSLAWIDSVRGLVTPRAYAGFLLTWIAADAARERDLAALWRLPWTAWRHGSPSALDLAVYVAIWTVSPSTRRRLSRLGLPGRTRVLGRMPLR